MENALCSIVKAIVDEPEDISLNIIESEYVLMYELYVGDKNLGKVIGKKGKNINAIRTLFSAANSKDGGKRAIIEVIE